MKKTFPGAQFFGIWGKSEAVSVQKIRDYHDLNVNGIWDILAHLPILNETFLELRTGIRPIGFNKK